MESTNLPTSMCKSYQPPAPVTNVADEITTSATTDNSWSFVNLHLGSVGWTAGVILVAALVAWLLFRGYGNQCWRLVTTSPATAAPAPPPASTAPPALPAPSAPSAGLWTVVDMSSLQQSGSATPGRHLALASGQLPMTVNNPN